MGYITNVLIFYSLSSSFESFFAKETKVDKSNVADAAKNDDKSKPMPEVPEEELTKIFYSFHNRRVKK